MAAAVEEAERREASEERITDTRMEVGGPEGTDKVEVEAAVVEAEGVEVAMEDPAMVGAATPTGAARQEPRVEAAGTTEDLTTGGERGGRSCLLYLYFTWGAPSLAYSLGGSRISYV